MASFSEEHVDVNGIDTAVFTAGDGDPIVFLSGAGTAPGFDGLLALADGHRLLVPHHPGFGSSADDTSITRIEDYVLHYLDLFDQLGLEELSIVGHSIGASMGAWLAAFQPRRVRRLVLAAPYGLRVPEHPTIDFFSLNDDEIPGYLANDMSVYAHYPNPPTPEFLALLYREGTSFARIGWERNYDLKLHKWLHRLTMPTLLLWGDADRLIPAEQASSWAELIPDAEVRTVPGAGHLLFNESQEAVSAVADFVGAEVAV
jgi:pimeloyl-ACP methyl ester carboxylesterase